MNNEQQQFIINHFQNMLTSDISRVIGVSRNSVMDYIIKNNIDKSIRKTSIISCFDGEYIKNNYLTHTSAEIGKTIGITGKQVRGWISNHIKEGRISKHRKFNNRFFMNIDSDEKAYYLGLIYADGWIHHDDSFDGNEIHHTSYEFGIELQESDKYLLEGLSAALGGVHSVTTHKKDLTICDNKKESHSVISKLRVYSKDIVNDLLSNGIDYNKTRSGVFPRVGREYFMPFLKGYIDGDGCIHKMKDGILGLHITSCSRGILDYINNMVFELFGFRTSIYSESENKYRIYWFSQPKVKTLLDCMYSIQTPELIRKRRVYEEFYGLSGR